jgi:hypothetical protein
MYGQDDNIENSKFFREVMEFELSYSRKWISSFPSLPEQLLLRIVMKLLIKRASFYSYFVILSYIIIIIPSAFADYFPSPSSTPLVCDFLGNIIIDNQPADPGDEIAFFKSNGSICGHYVVNRKGLYGFLHVYATDNAILSVQVWDASSQQLYTNDQIVLSAGKPVGTALSSAIPPTFKQNARFVLDVTTQKRLSDINSDGILNIVDIILILQYLSR